MPINKFFKFLFLTTFLIGIFITITSIFRGIILNDEGYIVNSAARLLNGQIIYKDFHFAYTPGSVYLTALLFALFGESIFAERLGALILTIITSFLLYKLGKKITKRKTFIILPVISFLSWGPTHINFLWPVMLSIPIGLAACLYIIKAIETQSSKYLCLAGCLTTFLFLIKQNFGLGLLTVVFLFFLFQKKLRDLTNIFYYLLGLLSISIIYAVYLYLTGTLLAFLQDMYDYTIVRIIIEHALDTPFLYGATLIQKVGKAIIYLSPLCISLASIFIVRRKSKLIILPLFCAMFYILGIRPTTDYVHLTPLLAISGLPLLLILVNTIPKFLKYITMLIFALLITTGFYTAAFNNYYRWQKPLWQDTIYQTDEKLRISLSRNNSDELNIIKHVVTTYAPNSSTIYVYDYQPMIYFLTNKHNPTKFDLLANNGYFLRAMPQIAQILNQKNVKLIITNKYFDYDQTILARYIKTNYHYIAKTENFLFWRRNF